MMNPHRTVECGSAHSSESYIPEHRSGAEAIEIATAFRVVQLQPVSDWDRSTR